jgi:branched-chain amino acid transport system substrate-binding protein
MSRMVSWASVLVASTLACAQAQADIRIGVILGLAGPNSSLGITYRRGLELLPSEIGGEKLSVIVLDET